MMAFHSAWSSPVGVLPLFTITFTRLEPSAVTLGLFYDAVRGVMPNCPSSVELCVVRDIEASSLTLVSWVMPSATASSAARLCTLHSVVVVFVLACIHPRRVLRPSAGKMTSNDSAAAANVPMIAALLNLTSTPLWSRSPNLSLCRNRANLRPYCMPPPVGARQDC